jgi:hypothetical protein
MDDLDLLAMDLRDEFDQIPEGCFDLRLLYLRVMTDIELARLDENQARLKPLPYSLH